MRRIGIAGFMALLILGLTIFRPELPSAQTIPFGFWKSISTVTAGSGGTTHPFFLTGVNGQQITNAVTTGNAGGILGYDVSSCSVYIGTAGGNIGCAVYADSAGRPGDLICHSANQAAVAASINTIPLTTCGTLDKNTAYWIAWNNDNGSIEYGEASSGSVCSTGPTMYYEGGTLGTWDDPFSPTAASANCLLQTYLTLMPTSSHTTPDLIVDPTIDPSTDFGDNWNDGSMPGASVSTGETLYPSGETWANGLIGEGGANYRYYGYFRYRIDYPVLAGSTVNNAIVKIYGNATSGWDSANDALRIWVQKTPSSQVPLDKTHYPGDAGGTVLTTASVRWPASGGLTWNTAGYNTSVDFSTAVQEVIDTYGGLQSGDYITVWIAKDTLTGTSHQVGYVDSVAHDSTMYPIFSLKHTPPASPGAASKLLIGGLSHLNTGYCSETRFNVTALDASNRTTNVGSNVTVNLSSSGGGSFYSDSLCTTVVTSVVISSGTNSKKFYFKNNSSETVTLTAADNAAVLTAGTLAVTSSVRPYTWIGNGGDSLWSNAANWSTGAAPIGYAQEAVYFDRNCVICNATLDVGVKLLSLHLVNGYTGTLTRTAGLSIDAGPGAVGYVQDSGTFLGGSTDIEHLGKIVITGGNYTATSGQTLAYYETTISGGTFNHGNGNFYIYSHPYSLNGLTFYDFEVGGYAPYLNGTITVDHNLIFNTGFCSLGGSGTLNLKGNLTMSGTNGNCSHLDSSLVRFVGTGAQTWSGADDVGSVEIAAGAGTVTISGSVNLGQNFTYTSGTVVTTGSTVIFNDPYENTATNLIQPGSMIFQNVTFKRDRTVTTISGTMNIAGNLTVNTSLTGGLDGGTINVAGNIVGTDWGTNSGNTAVTLNGTGAQTISRSAGTLPSGPITINKASGTASFSTNIPFNATQALLVNAGTLDLNGKNLTGSPDLTVANGATLQLKGSETVTIGTFTHPAGGTVVYNGTTDTSASNLKLGTAYANLTFNGVGGKWKHAATTVSGNFTITNGTVTANNTNISVAGDWSNSGTYTPGTNTVTLNGTNQSILGATTFYRLTKTVSSAATLTFAAGTTQAITNTLTLQGAVGQLLSLRSSSSGTQWTINPSGTRTIGYLDVKDSNNANGTAISGGGTSVNSGNNTNWTLP